MDRYKPAQVLLSEPVYLDSFIKSESRLDDDRKRGKQMHDS